MIKTNSKTNSNYKKILNHYFENNGIDLADYELDKMSISLKQLGIYSYNCQEDMCIYYIVKLNSGNRSVEKAINKLPDNMDYELSSKILFIVNSIQDKLFINTPRYKKEFKNALTKKLSLKKRINTIKDISAEFISNSRKKLF